MYSVPVVVMMSLALGILWSIGALVRMMQKTVGALDVYRYFLHDTCLDLDGCVVNIVQKVDGVFAE